VFSAPAQIETSEIRVWVLEDANLVAVEIRTACLTAELATFMAVECNELSRKLHDSTKRKIRVLHQWTLVDSYESRARDIIAAWGMSNIWLIESLALCISPRTPLVFRAAVHTTAGILNAIGLNISVVSDIRPALEALGVLGR
jgi:hypothetical protein